MIFPKSANYLYYCLFKMSFFKNLDTFKNFFEEALCYYHNERLPSLTLNRKQLEYNKNKAML